MVLPIGLIALVCEFAVLRTAISVIYNNMNPDRVSISGPEFKLAWSFTLQGRWGRKIKVDVYTDKYILDAVVVRRGVLPFLTLTSPVMNVAQGLCVAFLCTDSLGNPKFCPNETITFFIGTHRGVRTSTRGGPRTERRGLFALTEAGIPHLGVCVGWLTADKKIESVYLSHARLRNLSILSSSGSVENCELAPSSIYVSPHVESFISRSFAPRPQWK